MSIPLSFDTSFDIDKKSNKYIEVDTVTEIQIKSLLLTRMTRKINTDDTYNFSIKSIHEVPFAISLSLDNLIQLIKIFGDDVISVYDNGTIKALNKKDLYKFII